MELLILFAIVGNIEAIPCGYTCALPMNECFVEDESDVARVVSRMSWETPNIAVKNYILGFFTNSNNLNISFPIVFQCLFITMMGYFPIIAEAL